LHELTTRRSVDLKEVDLDDSTYHIPCFADTTLLEKSVERFGIINTPVLQEKSGALVPVLGRRRMKAAKLIGIDVIPALTLDPAGDVHDAFLLAFWDNIGARKLDAAVVSMLVNRILELFPIEFASDELFSHLGVPRSGPRIERLRRIGRLEPRIQAALSTGKLLEKTAFLLTGLDESERIRLFEFTTNLGYNANKRAELIENIIDIAGRFEKPITEIFDHPDIRSIIAENTGLPERAEKIRAYINELKTPDLVEKMRRFEAWSASLPRIKNTTIKHAPAFEDPNYRLEIHSPPEEIERILKKLSLIE
jgi:hypothetical protein